MLCQATTIHKSQGPRYQVVVMPRSMQHDLVLGRKLVYTGLTRGNRPVVLVGQKRAPAMAVKGRKSTRRWAKLKERLVPSSRI